MNGSFYEKSDKELVELYQKGMDKAFGILTERYSDYLKKNISSLTQDKEIINDITQEAYIKAMTAIKKGQYTDLYFKNWLARIAHNIFIDSCRKSSRMKIVSTSSANKDEEEFLLELPETNYNPEEEIFSREYDENIKKILKELVQNLPEEQKEIILLRMYHNFSFKEIAEYTNESINTCLGRMRYALINLRKQMGVEIHENIET